MKRLLIALVGLTLLAVPALAIAGVAGSDHDMTGGGEKLCYACHIPHKAFGEKLWASTPGSTYGDLRDLCATCHDGVTATAGVGTVFTTDVNIEQHKAVGSDCNGCHDVHNQGPNLTGKFIVDGLTATNGSYCETCHDDTPYAGAEGLGDHTAGITHFTDGTHTCNMCHTAHGAVKQTNNVGSLTNPILLADNYPSYYGAFCVSCHAGTAPTGGTGSSGGVAATDAGAYYAETAIDGTAIRHPSTATSTGSANWSGTAVGGCNLCHEVHDPTGTASGYILKADNTDSAYCVSCHNGTTGPTVGANSHPLGAVAVPLMNDGLVPALPWSDQIDEDGVAGDDWATASANNIVCESCHSVHRQGAAANAGYLLRDENTNNQICQACHSDN